MMDAMFEVVQQFARIIAFDVDFFAIDELLQANYFIRSTEAGFDLGHFCRRESGARLDQNVALSVVIIDQTRIIVVFETLEHFNNMPRVFTDGGVAEFGTFIHVFLIGKLREQPDQFVKAVVNGLYKHV
jgi:hypothetical protein